MAEKKTRAKKTIAKPADEEIKTDSTAESVDSATVQQVPVTIMAKEPMVKIRYIDSCMENNTIQITKNRTIVGSGKTFSVTKSEFEGEFMTAFTQLMIKQRKFIVLDGLTDDEREEYGCLYKEGEVITRDGLFDWLIDCPASEAVECFKDLCVYHREMVGKRMLEAYLNGDNRINRTKVEALNNISRKDYENDKGVFTAILEKMNEKI